ncbi:clathrin assembly family protein [Trifolium medium]|uniref:Clathrin assembly family protein n=1 Tax=Trifolium medium TaxID=97028 RepID=A0A392MHH8_9FABA|nr:clathrin assembly family protein [Trifolium medium]
MKRRFHKVCTSVKEQSYISYAKIASAAGFSDMNLIIIKATSPDDLPVHEKYIQHLLKLFSISPSSCHSFAISFTRRFGTTRSWRVALKSLILLHRLLRSVQGKSPLWAELLWIRSNGLISLYPCHFKDVTSSSSTCSNSYTKFVSSYAQLLDEALNCVDLDSKKLENQQHQEEKNETFQEKMNEMGEILEILPQLQSIIDRVIDCYPIGVATKSFIVQSAMKHIIRDSFVCYTKFRREIVVVLENLFEMSYRNCIAAFNIYKKSAVQTNKLCEFYEWCKAKGLCGYYEYPLLEPIPHIHIKALESFLSGMWQLTESSSSSWSDQESSSAFTEEDGRQQQQQQHMIKGIVDEEKPLIDLEGEYDDDNDDF